MIDFGRLGSPVAGPTCFTFSRDRLRNDCFLDVVQMSFHSLKFVKNPCSEHMRQAVTPEAARPYVGVFEEGCWGKLFAKSFSQQFFSPSWLPASSAFIGPEYLCVLVGQFERLEVAFEGSAFEILLNRLADVFQADQIRSRSERSKDRRGYEHVPFDDESRGLGRPVCVRDRERETAV